MVARKGRRHSGKRLQPPLPEAKEEPVIPKYFNMIRGSGYGKAEERIREIIPGPMPRAGETPSAIHGGRPMIPQTPFPSPAPEPERVPLLIRATRYIGAILGMEQEKPRPMPRVDGSPQLLRAGHSQQERPLFPEPEPAPEPEKLPQIVRAEHPQQEGALFPEPAPEPEKLPQIVRAERPQQEGPLFPSPAPEPERVPLLIRATRYIGTILGVEPERPIPMPVVPELNFPTLYTRFPVMKTVTKTTDVAGEIAVTYSHSFATIPGVVITVKDPDNVFGTVFATTLTGFDVRMFKIDHDHGGTVDTDGAHTPTINADGDHVHSVSGTITWDEYSQYGYLAASQYSDYETAHVHTQVQTQLESAHKHHVYPTSSAGAHTHSIPATDGPDDCDTAVIWIHAGTNCTLGNCINGWNESSYALCTHWHPNTGKNTGSDGAHTHSNSETGAGDAHRHLLNSTGAAPSPGHRHVIALAASYDHYITDISIDAFLETSAKESPYHAHTGANVAGHGHSVPLDGRVLLKNTNVTITYMAQEESS